MIPPAIRCLSPFCSDQNLQNTINQTLIPSLFQPCTERDIGNYFTPCSESDSKQKLMQYYKAPAMCDPNTGIKLHEPISLNCDFQFCPRGQFLSVESAKCEPCAKGKFHEGAVMFFANSTQWPAETEIKEFNVNNSVRLMSDGTSGDSPSIISLLHNEVTNVNASSYSELTFRVLLSHVPVRLKFDFRVFGGEMEQHFGSSFYRWIMRNTGEIYVRGTKEGVQSNTLLHENVVNNEKEWESREVEMRERGVYEMSIRFSRQFTRADTMNGMQVRNLRLEGFTDHATSCFKCPKGSYSDQEGSPVCNLCPKDTFAASEGASSCEPCPPGKSAFPGSSECTSVSIACTSDDYFPVELESTCFTPGSGAKNPSGRRRVKYQWFEPRVCFDNVTDAVQLPGDVTLPCPSQIDQCPGKSQFTHVEENALSCTHCEEGKVPTTQIPSVSCVSCPENSFPVNRSLVITDFVRDWDKLDEISTSCKPESQCQSKGFRRSTALLDSGVGNGRATSTLSFSVDSRKHYTASVVLNYTLHCKSGKGRASFLNDDVLVHVSECSSCTPGEVSSIELALRPAHKSKVTVEFTSFESAFSNSCDMMKIHSIELANVDVGGFSACQFCEDGTQLVEIEGDPTCVKCEPGNFAEKGSPCQKCPKNTYNQDYGSSKCFNCPPMMTSEEGSQACTFEKNPMEFSLPDAAEGAQESRYNWTTLIQSTLNAHRFEIQPKELESHEPKVKDSKKIIFSIPNFNPKKENLPVEENEENGSLRYPQVVCPPHSLACLEIEVDGVEEVFSIAEVAKLVDPKEKNENSLVERANPDTDNSITQTLRLYKENNRLCGFNTSMVDVNFVCSQHRTPLVQAKQISNCTFSVDVKSIESCKVCRADEFTMVRDVQCRDNKHLKHWNVKPGIMCNAISKPEDDWEWCVKESILYLAWVIPCIAFVVVCCVSTGCCVGTVTLLRRLKRLKQENEKLSLLRHQATHLELKDNGEELDEGAIASTP